MTANTVARMVDDLRRQIDGGTLAPNTKLPSTRVLMETYGLSDNAIYRGVALLKAQGYLEGRQGKGVFVMDRPITGGKERIEGITRPGSVIRWRHTIRTANVPDWAADKLDLHGSEAIERARLVVRDDRVIESSKSWVTTDIADVVPELDDAAPCNQTWQKLYEQRTGRSLTAAAKQHGARIATDDDLDAFALSPGKYALPLVRNAYLDGDRVIGVGEIAHAPNHFTN